MEELYTTILLQEEYLLTSNKEYQLKLDSLNIEKIKLQLGRSSQLKVDQLSMTASELNKAIVGSKNSIQSLKGELNDIMGREYDRELNLVPFEIPEEVEIPEYEALLSKATKEYDAIPAIERDIEKKEDDLDSLDDSDYQYDLMKLEVKEKELQLQEEKYKLTKTINNLLTEVQAKQEEYQLSLFNYKNAQTNYDWDQKRFELGRISKLDLMQSELNYLSAKDKNTAAGYSFYLAYRSLQLAEEGIL
ncbi:MAG: TolC family protein [Desulfuromonadales bacterium]|nr:TolC family protein [Desulfuromonadales bacterium]